MITLVQYFAAKPHTDVDETNADDLLTRVNALIDDFAMHGGGVGNCPNTGNQISGSKNGQGDGGFRLSTATTGATDSSHKQAKGVDVFDPHNAFDNWLSNFDEGVEKNSKLEAFGLYREHPASTPTWCHLTTRPPHSGHRTFWPK